MNQDDFKTLLDETLDEIRVDLKTVKDTQEEIRTDLKTVKDTQEEIRTDLKTVKDTQEEQVLPSVVTIEATIKAYGDMYKINNSNSKKLEQRIEVLEDKANVTPPPELTLADVA